MAPERPATPSCDRSPPSGASRSWPTCPAPRRSRGWCGPRPWRRAPRVPEASVGLRARDGRRRSGGGARPDVARAPAPTGWSPAMPPPRRRPPAAGVPPGSTRRAGRRPAGRRAAPPGRCTRAGRPRGGGCSRAAGPRPQLAQGDRDREEQGDAGQRRHGLRALTVGPDHQQPPQPARSCRASPRARLSCARDASTVMPTNGCGSARTARAAPRASEAEGRGSAAAPRGAPAGAGRRR